MAALSTLHQLVRAKCPGVIDLMMDDALAKVYREFCLRSEYLENTQVFNTVNGGDTLTLVPPSNHYVLNVVKVIRIENNRETELVPSVDYTQSTPAQIVLLGTYAYTQLRIIFTVCPTASFDAGLANDEIVERWSDEIAAGAAAELRLMPGEPWTSPELYDFYRRDFVRGWRDAKRAREEQFDKFNNYIRKRSFY